MSSIHRNPHKTVILSVVKGESSGPMHSASGVLNLTKSQAHWYGSGEWPHECSVMERIIMQLLVEILLNVIAGISDLLKDTYVRAVRK